MTTVTEATSGLTLDGLRVLDLTNELGAYCTKLLADFGASVVRIEPPGGEEMRSWPPFYESAEGPVSLRQAYYGANKHSVTLDLTLPTSKEIVDRLVADSDVLVLSSTPDELASWNLSPEELLERHSDLVVCSVTGFGLTGPYRNFRGSPAVIQAMGGFLYPIGPAQGPPPIQPGEGITNLVGTHAAFSILAALHARAHTGGQLIDISALEVLAGHDHALQRYAGHAVIVRRRDDFTVPSGRWECQDGAVEFQVWSSAQWDGFRALLGNPAELEDPRLSDPVYRAEHGEDLRPMITAHLAARTVDELITAAQELHLPSAPLNTPGGLLRDRHARARGSFRTTTHPLIGEFEVPAVPVRSNVPMWSYRTPAEAAGAYNSAVGADQDPRNSQLAKETL
jgi:crotonobetainyl-CoA:carnitine CoA-transferase CaiB-like acyl-CoA transferase